MQRKEDEEFYKSLSRKELQRLSKKFGLPANRSRSEMAETMAETMASYFQENLNSIPLEIQEVVGPSLQSGVPFNSLQGVRKDSSGLFSYPGQQGIQRNFPQIVHSNELVHFLADNNCNKEGLGGSTNCIQQSSGSGLPCKENGFPSKSASSSKYEFYVRSEDGINLCVDLNSSPLDWIKKLECEVNICDKMCKRKSRSFHEEVGCFGESTKRSKSSILLDVNADEIKDGHIESESYQSKFTQENNNVVLNHQDVGDGSYTSITITPSSTGVVAFEKLEDQGGKSSEPDSDRNNDIHSSTDETVCRRALDANDVNTLSKKLSGNSSVNVADCPVGLAGLDNLNRKGSDESFEYSTLDNSCSLVMVNAVCSEGASMEMLQTETQNDESCVAYANSENPDLVKSKDVIETVEGGLVNSSEPDLEESERIKHIVQREGSECTQFDDLFEKTCSRVDDVESDKKFHKRRTHVKNEVQNGHDKPPTKILRSTTAAKTRPRRSMRLGSK